MAPASFCPAQAAAPQGEGADTGHPGPPGVLAADADSPGVAVVRPAAARRGCASPVPRRVVATCFRPRMRFRRGADGRARGGSRVRTATALEMGGSVGNSGQHAGRRPPDPVWALPPTQPLKGASSQNL